MPSIGTVRRLRALSRVGWTHQAIGREITFLLPDNSALIVVHRADQVVVPQPDEVLCAGDELVFVSASGVEDQIWDLVHETAPRR